MERFTSKAHVSEIGVSASKKQIKGDYCVHWHEFYEIEYVVFGTGEYMIDGERYPIGEGMLFLMTPLSLHSVRTEESTIYNVMFSERLCSRSYLARFLESGKSLVLSLSDTDRCTVASLLSEIVSEERDEDYLSYLLNALLGKLLKLSNSPDERLRSAEAGILYLLQHFREAPSLSEVAAHAGFAPTYFSAIFKRETGSTYQEYLDRLRFDYARKLLMMTDATVIEICRESGFDDYPNFLRRFKRRFGMSPGEMRQRG